MRRRDFLIFSGAFLINTFLEKMVYAEHLLKRIEDFKKETPIGVVYHCDFPSEERFQFMCGNIRNHLSVYNFDPNKIRIVVVCNGDGVRFMMRDLTGSPWEKEKISIEENYKRLKELADYKVEFYVCAITVNRNKLDTKKLFEFVRLVPSGVATIAYLQTIGYAYIKSG